MTRNEKLNSIFSQFDKSAEQFCANTDGLYCEISSVYKGEEKPQNLQYRFAKIYYNAFAIKFVYTAHGIMSVVNSVLGCSVYLDKTEDAIGIPLSLATDYCDMDFATPMCIPCITNNKGMIQAFECIGSVLLKSLDRFAEISCNAEYKARLLTAFTNEMNDLFELDGTVEMNGVSTNVIVDFFTLRFSSSAYISYIKGNAASAVKQLKKIKKLTGYEKRLLALWKAKNREELPDLSAIITNLEAYSENGTPKTDFREFGATFFSWLLLSPVISALYAGIYFLLVYVEGVQSVYLMGPAYNYPNSILFGFITAIAVSYFTRFKFYKWLYKNDYEKYCETEFVQNGNGADKFMKGFLTVVVVASVAGCLLFSKWNLNFLPDGFTDNSKFFSLKGEYYAYSEIEKVYYKPDRVNGLDETLNFPSYVLVLKDKTEIDLYELGEISDYENKLVEYLRIQGVKIETGVS